MHCYKVLFLKVSNHNVHLIMSIHFFCTFRNNTPQAYINTVFGFHRFIYYLIFYHGTLPDFYGFITRIAHYQRHICPRLLYRSAASVCTLFLGVLAIRMSSVAEPREKCGKDAWWGQIPNGPDDIYICMYISYIVQDRHTCSEKVHERAGQDGMGRGGFGTRGGGW